MYCCILKEVYLIQYVLLHPVSLKAAFFILLNYLIIYNEYLIYLKLCYVITIVLIVKNPHMLCCFFLLSIKNSNIFYTAIFLLIKYKSAAVDFEMELLHFWNLFGK